MADGVITNNNSEWEYKNLGTSLGSGSIAYGYINKKARIAMVSFNAGTKSGDGTINIASLPSKYTEIYASLRGGGYLQIESATSIKISGAQAYNVGQIVYPLAD